jgi:hypothetical protein
MKKDKDDHTVEYTPIDYHCLGHNQKERVKKMQSKEISTPYDAASTPQEVEGRVAEKRYGTIFFV